MPATFARLRRTVFERHANPLSAWSRWATTPLVLVPVWTRKWTHAVPVLVWMIANAVVFPKPQHERAWATRAVLGEEMWLVDRPRDAAMAVNAGGTAFLAAALVAARKRTLLPAVAATTGAMALIMVYWKQMVDYYDTERATRGELPTATPRSPSPPPACCEQPSACWPDPETDPDEPEPTHQTPRQRDR